MGPKISYQFQQESGDIWSELMVQKSQANHLLEVLNTVNNGINYDQDPNM